MLGLVQRELVGTAVEVVAPVFESVRPGNENLSPARWALFAARIPVEDLMSPGRVRAETAAHLVDDDPLAVSCELDVHDRRLPGAARRHIIRSRVMPMPPRQVSVARRCDVPRANRVRRRSAPTASTRRS